MNQTDICHDAANAFESIADEMASSIRSNRLVTVDQVKRLDCWLFKLFHAGVLRGDLVKELMREQEKEYSHCVDADDPQTAEVFQGFHELLMMHWASMTIGFQSDDNDGDEANLVRFTRSLSRWTREQIVVPLGDPIIRHRIEILRKYRLVGSVLYAGDTKIKLSDPVIPFVIALIENSPMPTQAIEHEVRADRHFPQKLKNCLVKTNAGFSLKV